MRTVRLIAAPWREPAEVVACLGEAPWTLGLISGGAGARWSYVMTAPDAVLSLSADDPRDPFAALADLAASGEIHPEGPPFQGGVAGLLSYDLADRIERLGLGRLDGWPDIACGRYPALLAFDHADRCVVAIGRGGDGSQAQARAEEALGWLHRTAPVRPAPTADLTADSAPAYEAAVAEVVERIRSGEFFQANIARRWRGRLSPGADPADLMARLTQDSPAPFAAYLRLSDRALVSNSPERFIEVRADGEGLVARTEPIKGTVPRGATPDEDAALAAALLASAKDRAENLMIVDLMRNDLSRVCAPGEVRTPELFRLASFANVHHLVSTVTGRLARGMSAVDLLRAAFPPGSITGAPKVQAMTRIAALEAPRGPFFGSIFHLGVDGAMDSSVLIRTAAFVADDQGWRVEARAGAGIVADSDPASERRETETKIAALLAALRPGA